MLSTRNKRPPRSRTVMSALCAMVLATAGTAVASHAAFADEPAPHEEVEFNAPLCAGTTDFDPSDNSGSILPDATLMFGERLSSYHEGRIVPLYDAFGGTVLIDEAGGVTDVAAYPPICGTRYEPSVGGPVSEWMFCTDLDAMSCGDTNGEGQLVDANGDPVSPMEPLAGNSKLTDSQEKLIAYLIQNGHPYEGIGDQSFGNAEIGVSNGSSDERAALQTLVWCISDSASPGSDFAATCELNMPEAEQERLLQSIPTNPELVLAVDTTESTLETGQTASFTLSTNILNQPIGLVFGGTAEATWEVCEGDADLDGAVLTVSGTDPASMHDVGLCATSDIVGTTALTISATPPSVEHIEWAQGAPTNPDSTCQVFATFHSVNQVSLSAHAQVEFVESGDPAVPEVPVVPVEPVDPDSGGPSGTPMLASNTPLAATGTDAFTAKLLAGAAIILLVVGGTLVYASRKQATKNATPTT